ncbi:M48 family metalloprotease [bacterium]|nr:M48 family metalloprotease [bacterium]
MKKFILIIAVFCFGTLAYADTFEAITNKELVKIQKNIDEVGFNILNSNGIEQRTVFNLNIKRIKNAHLSYRDREITIYRDLYNRLSSDDELSYILAHEISHSVDSYNGIMRGFFTPLTYRLSPKKYEYKADKRAVDYMVQAGYNPVASIVVMNKCFGQYRYDWYSSHPVSSRRMMEVYEYIYKKYPEYLVNNAYKTNPYYQNFLLTSKQNRAKFQKKVQSNSKSGVKYL